MPIFETVIASIEKAEQTDELLASPRTYQHNIKRDISAAANLVTFPSNADDYFKALLIIFREIFILHPQETIRTLQRASESNTAEFLAEFSHLPAYNALDELVKAAEAISINESNDIFNLLKTDETDRNFQIVVSVLHRASSAEGELRADVAMQAAKKASEALYQPYVRTLHRLFRLKRNIRSSANLSADTYGEVFNKLLESTFPAEYPGLLRSDAVLVRNAEAHENWNYLPDTDEVEVSSISKKGVQSKRLSVDELLALTEEMLRMSAVMLPRYIRLRGYKSLEKLGKVINQIKDILPDLLSPAQEKRTLAAQLLAEHIAGAEK